MFRFLGLFILLVFAATAHAQNTGETASQFTALRGVIETNIADIKKGSVKTAPPIIKAIDEIGGPGAVRFLTLWQEKALWYSESDDTIFVVEERSDGQFDQLDLFTGELIATSEKKSIKQIKPNSGLRALIAEFLVTAQLQSTSEKTRRDALVSLARTGKADYVLPLREAIAKEQVDDLKAQMMRLERLLTMRFGATSAERVAAIESFENDLSVETRANLNRLVTSTIKLEDQIGDAANVAGDITPGAPDFSVDDAYEMLIALDIAKPIPTLGERKQILIEHIEDGKIDGFTIHALDNQANRDAAYLSLVANGRAPFWSPGLSKDILVAQHRYVRVYDEADPAVTTAVEATLKSIGTRVAASGFFDVFLDGLSLASIYFLAAIGLAITFGVMRVINMAHGEFIMMGAYTGYLVQQVITNYTLSIIIAVPLAFGVTFAAGVVMERLVIRHLYHRPLETLLATFGISIALQQLAKNIFGTQARPLTAPAWLDGALVINDVISISWIRIAIFGLSILFFVLLMFVLNKTRFGLETRAVTQNRRMAANMGINPNLINMLTFGLGSGIAGIAGVAIGLYAKVTSEMGADYIVQSFMTVVVGGVGNIWGTLAGAVMIGFLQKGIEWFNPANTLAAQTYMIIFIIIFIQFRPRGIIALKGRAAGD